LNGKLKVLLACEQKKLRDEIEGPSASSFYTGGVFHQSELDREKQPADPIPIVVHFLEMLLALGDLSSVEPQK
jgi:hypothetical protein